MTLLQGEVKDLDCLIMDDMIDTGGTIMKCVDYLKSIGAKKVFVYATHGLFNGNFFNLFKENKTIDCIYVSDSVLEKEEEKVFAERIKRISLASLLIKYIDEIDN